MQALKGLSLPCVLAMALSSGGITSVDRLPFRDCQPPSTVSLTFLPVILAMGISTHYAQIMAHFYRAINWRIRHHIYRSRCSRMASSMSAFSQASVAGEEAILMR